MHYVTHIYFCCLLLKVQIFAMWMLAAALMSLLHYSAVGMNADVTINLVYEFISENRPKAAVAMTCWKAAGNGCLYSRFIVYSNGVHRNFVRGGFNKFS